MLFIAHAPFCFYSRGFYCSGREAGGLGQGRDLCVQARPASDRLLFRFLVRWGGDPGWNVTDGLGCLSITMDNY